jgi:multicomponent Na+:H+ antiporter subunit C
MSAGTVFGLCAAVAVGLGLYGVITNPQPLRKILAFNLIGSGVFTFFGVVANRGAAAGFGGDPIPQALVITGSGRGLFGDSARDCAATSSVAGNRLGHVARRRASPSAGSDPAKP